MTLASADDIEGGEALLINRFRKEYPNGGSVWIGGEVDGYCSAITGFSGGIFVREWRLCSGAIMAYCEFNGNFFWFYRKIK